jgi:hypothetical protein
MSVYKCAWALQAPFAFVAVSSLDGVQPGLCTLRSHYCGPQRFAAWLFGFKYFQAADIDSAEQVRLLH